MGQPEDAYRRRTDNKNDQK